MIHEAIPVANLIIDNSKPLGNIRESLGKARESAISKVNTNRFVFVDDDIVLPKDWFQTIMKYWKRDTGWLEGWTIPTQPEWYRKWTLFRFYKSGIQNVLMNQRGFTADTIIKTDLVRDWTYLGGFEDLSMSNHVISKGYTVLRAPIACYHHIGYDVFKQAKMGARLQKRTYREKLRYVALTTGSGFKASFSTKDLSICKNAIKLSAIALLDHKTR